MARHVGLGRNSVEVAPLDFSDPDGLCLSMQGAGAFYNTYWVRYGHGRITFDLAVENTRMLFEAAKRAGVGRIVHLRDIIADHERFFFLFFTFDARNRALRPLFTRFAFSDFSLSS